MPEKVCPSCSGRVHVRRSQCDCGYMFYAAANPAVKPAATIKSASQHASVKPPTKIRKTAMALRPPWSQLREGDLIKIDGGGPYWKNAEGKNIEIGEYGEFVVDKLVEDGFYARDYGKNVGFTVFLPMKPCSHHGVVYEPYSFKYIDNIFDRALNS